MTLLRRFLSEGTGQFAVLTALLIAPLIASVGLALDYSRYVSAKSFLQDVADATSLSLAAADTKSNALTLEDANNMVSGNDPRDWVKDVAVSSIVSNKDFVDLTLSAHVNTTFMSVFGHDELPVTAEAKAERALLGSVELSLVLDNTDSMTYPDPTKIVSLRAAARALVDEVMTTDDGAIKIALVPYGQYINVGTKYRSKTWLSVPADYKTEATSASGCVTKTKTETTCKTYNKTTCTRPRDGATETYSCNGTCAFWNQPKETSYQECQVPAKAAQTYKWNGCIGSRKTGTTRLDDGTPSIPYPGYLDTPNNQTCLKPIVPLSTDKKALLAAIDGMVTKIDNHAPATYIPSGLIWGFNTLSPTEPLDEAKAYDPNKKLPRKVAILMTDGENTLRFQSSDGRHPVFSTNATTKATQFATVNTETETICKNMKAKGIEIYSVAFMVNVAAAKTMLQNCATDKDHYYDASDAAKLVEAFKNISKSLRTVRLAS